MCIGTASIPECRQDRIDGGSLGRWWSVWGERRIEGLVNLKQGEVVEALDIGR